ncbi:lysylphosphatidylglycerol synthase domain-containing protein [Exiguobacterium sp. s133]|uniref:lysylphosphatidylglycerol synthase domain-containing protein n=1 Tax=Exiguobacterium sp. s133 TaxID=2751213 RepID=UPI001BEAB0BC|nr:lysylphosphatidylglycerol synthase domain-containing protein [Exiguobacterium sp. s133]
MASRAHVIRTTASVLLTLAVVFLLIRFVLELPVLYDYLRTLSRSYWTLLASLLYAGAFYVRAVAWRVADQRQAPLPIYLTSLYLGLAVNHLSPVKLGEGVRLLTARAIASPLKRTTAILVAQRGIDLVVLGLFVSLGLLATKTALPAGIAIVLGVLALVVVRPFLRTMYALIGYGTLAWCLEAGAVYCLFLGVNAVLPFPLVLIAMSAGVLSGIAQFTPGGLGAYELAMGTVLQTAGVDHPYELALMTHTFKYAFAFIAPLYFLVRHHRSVTLLFRQFKNQQKGGSS